MKIKKIKRIQINTTVFSINWDKRHDEASLSYKEREINIGIKSGNELYILESIMHEIFEIVAIEMYVRFGRSDCNSDYIFVFDHRQHTTIQSMMAGIISKFIM